MEQTFAKEKHFLMENAKLKWHKQGDRKISYFHKISKIKGARNMITTSRDGENQLIDPSEMVALTVNYFTNIFYFTRDVHDSDLIDILWYMTP